MTTQEWDKIAAYLLAAYEATAREVSAAKLVVYYEQLQREEAADVWQAVRTCVGESKYFPTVAEIAAQLPKRSQRLTAVEAWEHVIRSLGNKVKEPEWPDGLIGKCVRGIGGWWKLNLEPLENLPFRRREFIELYNAKAQREEREERLQLEGEVGQAVKTLAGALALEDKR